MPFDEFSVSSKKFRSSCKHDKNALVYLGIYTLYNRSFEDLDQRQPAENDNSLYLY